MSPPSSYQIAQNQYQTGQRPTTEADELDWILMQSKQAVLFYDSMQVVGPSGIDFERFDCFKYSHVRNVFILMQPMCLIY